jgi:hypothetical protein
MRKEVDDDCEMHLDDVWLFSFKCLVFFLSLPSEEDNARGGLLSPLILVIISPREMLIVSHKACKEKSSQRIESGVRKW